MRDLTYRCVVVVMVVVCGIAPPLRAQTDIERIPLAQAAASPIQPAADESFDASLILPGPTSAESLWSLGWAWDDAEPGERLKDEGQVIQPPAGPPPTPRHTGIKAM